MDNIWNSILILTALGGFLLALYIRHKKRTHEKMVCPLNSDCDVVIYSEYSKFLGIPVEVLGLFYYGAIAVGYSLFLAFPDQGLPFFAFAALVLTIVAFLFSLYLTFIQAFSLRQWCAWCLMSAGLCTVIFATALSVSEFGFVSLLGRYHELIVLLHVFGVALGLGGATITDIFFFKFLKDFRISKWEADVMHTLSQVIWFALALLVLTGLGLYLPEAEELNQSAKFLMKMIIVTVIIVNGAFLNLLVVPKMVKGQLHHVRKIAFALGSVSMVSWYSAFILGMFRKLPFEFSSLLLTYLALLGGAIVASQFMERFFVKRANVD